MPLYVLIPFAVFAACCVAQFWFMKKVRDALIERHPQTFLKVEKASIFPYQGLWRFTRGKAYQSLHDEELDRHVRKLKRLNIVAVGSWIAYGIAIFSVPTT